MEPFDSLRSLRAFSLSVARHERTWRFAGGEAPGESNGGGGGSRTRVRKRVVVGLYMRVRFWVLMPDVRKRRKTARHQSR